MKKVVSLFLSALIIVAGFSIGPETVQASSSVWQFDLDNYIINDNDFEGTTSGMYYGSTYSDPQLKLVGKPGYLTYTEVNGSTVANSTTERDIAWTIAEDESYTRDGKTYTLEGKTIKFGNAYKKPTDSSPSTMKIIVPFGNEIQAAGTVRVFFDYRSPSWVEVRAHYYEPGKEERSYTDFKCDPTKWKTAMIEIDSSRGFMNYSGNDLKYTNECGFFLESQKIGPYYIRNIRVETISEPYAEIIPDPSIGSTSGVASYYGDKIALGDEMMYYDSTDARWECEHGGDTLYGYSKVDNTDVVYLARCFRNEPNENTYKGTRIGIDLSQYEFPSSNNQLVVEVEYYDGPESGPFNFRYNKTGESAPRNKVLEQDQRMLRDGKWRRVAVTLPADAVINESGDTEDDIGISLEEINYSLNIRAIRVMSQTYYQQLLEERAAIVSDVPQSNQWKYASISFSDAVANDTIIGGISLYGAENLVTAATPSSSNGNCSYVTSIGSDGCMRRSFVGGKDCVQLVNYWRTTNSQVIYGNLYFSLSNKFTTSDKNLYVEIVYFDEGTGSFNLRYKNKDDSSSSKTVSVKLNNTNKWVTKRIHLTDACFNGKNSTGLGDGKCDFRIEKTSTLTNLYIKKVSVYDEYNTDTGRSFQTINIDGQYTEKPYFTTGMWTNDNKNLILYADGWIYKYNIATEELKALVESGTDNYWVTKNNNVYYWNYFQKEIRRINTDTYVDEFVTGLYSTDEFRTLGEPQNINVNEAETKLNFMIKEHSDDPVLHAENLTDTTGVSIYRRIPVYDLTNGTWDLSHRFHKFDEDEPFSGHMFINPKYDNLVFFAHEGESKDVPDRMWVMDLDTNEEINIFPQQMDGSGNTLEACGHESWVADGEHMLFVKYPNSTNIGMNGIMRVDKYGENYEYINNDYKYWHCNGSADNKYVIADTNYNAGYSGLVLIDIKSGTSKQIAYFSSSYDTDGHPHPAFSPDGKKVVFTCVNDDGKYDVAIMDISDIIDSKNNETFEKAVSEDYGFEMSEVSQSNGKSTVSIKGLRKDFTANMFGASYSGNALTSFSKDQAITQRGAEAKLEVTGSDYFLWGDELEPIEYPTTAPERVRVIKNNGSVVQLIWGKPLNYLSDGVTYEVKRNGTLYKTVSTPYFCDDNVSADTDYSYQIRAVYPSGKKTAYTGIDVHTGLADAYIKMAGDQFIGEGLDHIFREDRQGSDLYTVGATIGDLECRKAPYQSSYFMKSKFYFNVKSSSINANDNNIKFTIKYYDYGSGQINIAYKSTKGSDKSVKFVSLGNTNAWKTATLTVSDAQFIDNDLYKNGVYDFYLVQSSNRDLYISEVKVENTNTSSQTAQRAFWSSSSSDGMSKVSTSGNTSYFGISDSYICGTEICGVTLVFDYYDNGTGNITVGYSNSAGTTSSVTAVKKTGTNTTKTAKVFIVDACFKNKLTGYADFSIQSDGTINNVQVIKGYAK